MIHLSSVMLTVISYILNRSTDHSSLSAQYWEGLSFSVEWRGESIYCEFRNRQWRAVSSGFLQPVVTFSLPDDLTAELFTEKNSDLSFSIALKQMSKTIVIQGGADHIYHLSHLLKPSFPDIESLVADKLGEVPAVFMMMFSRQFVRRLFLLWGMLIESLSEWVTEHDHSIESASAVRAQWKTLALTKVEHVSKQMQDRILSRIFKSMVKL